LDEAVATAGQAITRAVASGATPVAVASYAAFTKQRASLTLKAEELDQLAWALLEQSKFADAVWCFAASGKAGGQAAKVQKGLVAAAEGYSKAGSYAEAVRVCEFVIKQAPGTPNAKHCEGLLATARARLSKPS
jgi:hypothetical protein